MISRDDLREFLLGLPGANRDRIEIGLAHPQGLQTIVPGMGTVGFVRHGDLYEIVENFEMDNKVATDRRVTAAQGVQNMKKLARCLLVGPALISDGPAPLGPKKALTIQDEVLARSGTYFMKTDRRPFDPSNPADLAKHTEEVLARFPGARLASSPAAPKRRYIGQEANEVISRACSTDPEFGALDAAPTVLVATKAEPVSRPRIEGTIDRSVIRADRAASESQAAAVMDRVRAKQASDPTLRAAAQRSDGSFYRPDGAPHENLSMGRMPADKDPRPGTAVTVYSREQIAAMDPYHQRILKAAKPYRCENCGSEGFSQNPRRFCDAHVGSGRGGEGLYDQEK
jgi:hypothetical protein